MPELPEVETIRQQLTCLIIGLTIKKIDILNSKSFIGDPKLLTGAGLSKLRRFAKLLVFDFDTGLSLAVHLKMSGQLLYKSQKLKVGGWKKHKDLPDKYTRVGIEFTNGDRLFFNDIRKFGWMRIIRKQETGNRKQEKKKIPLLNTLISKLGPDPLSELTEKKFLDILKSSKRPIKLVLMDQEKIGGIGNIYANEALFLAKINPKKRADQLAGLQISKLFKNIRKVLRDGVKWGGASRLNYRDAFGNKGEVQEHFSVYDREGEKCINGCGGLIRKIRLGGRGTYYCLRCQL